MGAYTNTFRKATALILAVIMSLGAAPLNALAEIGQAQTDTLTIISFEPLADDTAHQVVPFGTDERELNLPVTLNATVQLPGYDGEQEPPPNIGEPPETTTPAALVATPTDIQEYPLSNTTNNTPTSPQFINVQVPVTWQSTPTFNGMVGEFVFTATLGAGFVLADGVYPPQISVEVEPLGIMPLTSVTVTNDQQFVAALNNAEVSIIYVTEPVHATQNITLTRNLTLRGGGSGRINENLTINQGVTLRLETDLAIFGTGVYTPPRNGTLTNNGTIITAADFWLVIQGATTNTGTITIYGELRNRNNITNTGLITNNGTTRNYGTIDNTNGTIDSQNGAWPNQPPTGGTFHPPHQTAAFAANGNTAAQNGVTATGAITGSPAAAGSEVTVTVTFGGNATLAGVHTLGLTGTGITVTAEDVQSTIGTPLGNDITFTFAMPNNGVSNLVLTHEFEPAFAVTVNGGTGGGNFMEGATVNINANAPQTGYKFSSWTTDSPGVTFTDADSTSTSFTMPSNDVTVTANFEPIPPDEHAITVTSEGGGTANAIPTSAAQGTAINLTATPNTGHRFVEWRVISGGATLTVTSATTATFTMPDNAVEIRAVFELIAPRLTSLSVRNFTISPAFNPATLNYSVRVNTATNTVTVDYTASPNTEVEILPVSVLGGTDITHRPQDSTFTVSPLRVGENNPTIVDIVVRSTVDRTVIATYRLSIVRPTGAQGGNNGNNGGGQAETQTPPTPSHNFQAGSTFVQGTGENLVLTIDRAFTQFRDVRVNNRAIVRGRDFTAESGSTVITLLADYLDTLDVGRHSLDIRFANNVSVRTNFTVAERQVAPTPAQEPTPAPIISEVITIYEDRILELLYEGEDFVIEREGITVTIPNAIIEGLHNEEPTQPIAITVTVTPTEIKDEDGNLPVSENGNLLTVVINIAVGYEQILEIATAITVAVRLENFDLEDMNINRLVALCDDGTLLGGRLNNETGIFLFAAQNAGAFTITYVADLRRLAVQLDSPVIRDLAGNADAQIMDVLPIIVHDRTLLPIRFIAYALGAEVDWTQATDYRPLMVYLTLDGQTLSFGIGEITPELFALGMDVPARIEDNRTMVPLRFISEFFGAVVSWNGETRTAEILFIPYSPTEEDEENGYGGGGYHAIIGKPEDEEDGITES